jgi:hypothetical protein
MSEAVVRSFPFQYQVIPKPSADHILLGTNVLSAHTRPKGFPRTQSSFHFTLLLSNHVHLLYQGPNSTYIPEQGRNKR